MFRGECSLEVTCRVTPRKLVDVTSGISSEMFAVGGVYFLKRNSSVWSCMLWLRSKPAAHTFTLTLACNVPTSEDDQVDLVPLAYRMMVEASDKEILVSGFI